MSSEQQSENFYCKGKNYWEQIDASLNGMLGGFTNVNVVDVDESRGLLKKLFKKLELETTDSNLRVLDCGAGIGRVTKYVLSQYFDEIDMLEQNEKFLTKSKDYLGNTYLKVKNVFPTGIQEFCPLDDVKYDCIWGQWVFGYITDEDFIEFLKKCSRILKRPNGFIVIKDNVVRQDNFIVDDEDGSVIRSEWGFKEIFENVDELELKYKFKQKKMPKELLPVSMFVLTLK